MPTTQAKYKQIKNLLESKIITADVVNGVVYNRYGKITGTVRKDGYCVINVANCNVFVHQVIVTAAGLNPVGLEINHKDLNKQNNKLNNLEVIPHKRNTKHWWRDRYKKAGIIIE